MCEFIHAKYDLEAMFCLEDSEKEFETYNPQIITFQELNKISNLKSPNKVLAVFKMPEAKELQSSGIKLVLDDINDPGNLGTIIRLCDWFGVQDLICSPNTVDCFNSKVVQSTMGSLSRVNICYQDIETYVQKESKMCYVADMDGEEIYHQNFSDNAIIVMGNEANGVSASMKKTADKIISIPRFGSVKATESLNVATATAIILSEFKRVTER